ncbi:MAG: neutral/alkaline non-lysosomal ceramidase N-terminal domain-containing protein, partial [Opitutaceae bacterium]|nr:neutral/alkaline non-lysosomal ceramidase N-terminal domain-containing protein [Opitutaceae bacterium]
MTNRKMSRLARWIRACMACALLISPLSLIAAPATASTPTSERTFRAGAATSNITPLLGVKLDGGIMQIGPATHVHDELHARCLVLDDGTSRLAFVVCDNTMIATEVIEGAKRMILEATGLDPSHVMISATHSHSTPRGLDLKLGEKNLEYNQFLSERVADGVHRAINNLQPAIIGWGSGNKPEFVQNRRWLVEPDKVPANPFGEKGERVVMGASPAHKIGPSGPVDPELFLVSIRHLDGRPLAALASYGLHYVGGIPNGVVSADYYGVFADEMQRQLGADRQSPPFVAMMANGTSGDVRTPAVAAPEYERMHTVAEELAREAVHICNRIQYHSYASLDAAQAKLTLSVRRPSPERLAWANQVYSGVNPKAKVLTRPQVYAREARYLAAYPPTVTLTLQAYRIGT